jgi:hypothetical protein
MASLVSADTKAAMYGTAAYHTASKAMLDFTPINQVCAALNATHVYADQPSREHRLGRHQMLNLAKATSDRTIFARIVTTPNTECSISASSMLAVERIESQSTDLA